MHTRAATAREAAKGVFPFLELPPEIRISIYEFALGGNTIYYTTELSSDFFDYAGHVHRSKALGGEVKAPEDTMDREDDSPRRHYRCAHYKRQHLSVISLCKQTHNEAALFPFITNTFVFDTPKHLDRFSKSLRAIQRKSVRAAVLHEAGGQRLWSPWNPDPKAAMLSSLLPGLQSLTLFWEVVPRDLLPSMKGSRSGADLEESGDRLIVSSNVVGGPSWRRQMDYVRAANWKQEFRARMQPHMRTVEEVAREEKKEK